VTIDLSRFVHPADVTMLVGAPPGYVGYGDTVPLHRLAQMPWCVVRLEHIHACHPQVREVLTQTLADGFITDSRGRRLYLSDTIVLLTAEISAAARHAIGFQRDDPVIPASITQSTMDAVEGALGAALAAQVDLVCTLVLTTDDSRRRWLEQALLADLSARYRKQGIELTWDESCLGATTTR
jgi:ATP-dependent Clp protease ATP-binding subunit ClpC